MTHAEFDSYTAVYEDQHAASIRASGEAPAYFAEYKIRVLAEMCKSWGFDAPGVLDFGSGLGNSVPYFQTYLPRTRLHCADVSAESLKLSQAQYGPKETYHHIEGGVLPLADDAVDVCFTACVFHHIPEDEHIHWLEELARVTRPGGRLVIFEHNPLNPLTRRAVANCPFDENAVLIGAREMRRRMAKAGWSSPRADFHVFFPKALSGLRRLDPYLAWCPMGGQYAASAKLA